VVGGTVSKLQTRKFDADRFDIKKLNDTEATQEYQVDISNRNATLENSDNSGDINTT
jgi:hypothetical protein